MYVLIGIQINFEKRKRKKSWKISEILPSIMWKIKIKHRKKLMKLRTN